MKSLFLIITFLAALSMACSTTKKGMSESDEYTVFQNVPVQDSLFAFIERGFCFGTCPVYELYIYTNGFATYRGKQNVERMGTYTGKFTPEQMNQLIASASEIGYMEFEDVYDDPNVTDRPTVTTSIVISGERKQVRRRHDFPLSIKTFESKFDELVDNVKWTKVNATEPPR